MSKGRVFLNEGTYDRMSNDRPAAEKFSARCGFASASSLSGVSEGKLAAAAFCSVKDWRNADREAIIFGNPGN